jgi:hypothetical protein
VPSAGAVGNETGLKTPTAAKKGGSSSRSGSSSSGGSSSSNSGSSSSGSSSNSGSDSGSIEEEETKNMNDVASVVATVDGNGSGVNVEGESMVVCVKVEVNESSNGLTMKDVAKEGRAEDEGSEDSVKKNAKIRTIKFEIVESKDLKVGISDSQPTSTNADKETDTDIKTEAEAMTPAAKKRRLLDTPSSSDTGDAKDGVLREIKEETLKKSIEDVPQLFISQSFDPFIKLEGSFKEERSVPAQAPFVLPNVTWSLVENK